MRPEKARSYNQSDNGDPVTYMESPRGSAGASRAVLGVRIQSELEGGNRVEEPLIERRLGAAIEDAGWRQGWTR